MSSSGMVGWAWAWAWAWAEGWDSEEGSFCLAALCLDFSPLR